MENIFSSPYIPKFGREIVIPNISNFKHLKNSSDILVNNTVDDDLKRQYPGIVPDREIEESLAQYYGSGHVNINNFFRDPETHARLREQNRNEIIRNIANIDRAMEMIKPYRLIDNFVVWRGIKIDNLETSVSKKRYYENILKLPNTKIINEPSYLSTSYDFDSALSFSLCCLFEIIVERSQGLKYILIEIEGEKEILFEHSTHFKYVRSYKESHPQSGRKIDVFVVELKKGLAPSSTAPSSSLNVSPTPSRAGAGADALPLIESKDPLKSKIIERAENLIGEEDIDTIKSDFEFIGAENGVEDVATSYYNQFIEQLKKEGKSIEFINSLKPNIKKIIYDSIEKIINNKE